MKTHYIFIPDTADFTLLKSYSSLRQLCEEHGLNYPNADYHLNRKKDGNGTFSPEPEANAAWKVAKAEHTTGKRRGSDNFGK